MGLQIATSEELTFAEAGLDVFLSSHQPQLIFTIIYFGWSLPLKTLVRPLMVVKIKVFFQGLAQLLNGFKFVYVNFLILHTAP